MNVDDLLDDAHWMNVQDPIKQMFLSITKALRVQSASIRELDRKCSDYVSRDFVKHQLQTLQDSTCSKADGTQIIYQLQNKIDQRDYIALQTKYEKVREGFVFMVFLVKKTLLDLVGGPLPFTRGPNSLTKYHNGTIGATLKYHVRRN